MKSQRRVELPDCATRIGDVSSWYDDLVGQASRPVQLHVGFISGIQTRA